tara:strand:+ start:5200 stop:6423 length:1224 start_codon:yes stop_codon:yes gene_type:complete
MIHCRLCDSKKLTQFLDLGSTPPADQFRRIEQLSEPEIHYPLKVVRCDKCMFIQLNYVVSPEILYRNDYPYESSITKTGREHFKEFALSVIKLFNLSKNDLVIDIGSNVGVLLDVFKNEGCRVIGIDPAVNIVRIAEKNNVETIPEFFSIEVAKKIIKSYGKAKIITASNVFAHIDDLNSMMNGIDCLLDEDGVFIVEAPYLVNLLNKLEYDTIYHEHLSYLSLVPLIPFLYECGFELFDVSQVDIHGGSIRLFISRKNKRKVSKAIHEHLTYENENAIYSIDNLIQFAKKVEKNRDDLVWLLKSLKREGKQIAGVSAPAKGMTLLNYCKIGKETLCFLTEKSTLKIGRFAPGNNLPVYTDSALIENNIDYALLLAWNFKDEIMKNLTQFKGNGGKFIIPIPEPTII